MVDNVKTRLVKRWQSMKGVEKCGSDRREKKIDRDHPYLGAYTL